MKDEAESLANVSALFPPIHGHYWLRASIDVRSFLLCWQGSSLLWTSTLRPFEFVQCASPGRGWDLIGGCGVCTM